MIFLSKGQRILRCQSYLIALDKLKEVFSDEAFFEKLLPYVDVHNIARV